MIRIKLFIHFRFQRHESMVPLKIWSKILYCITILRLKRLKRMLLRGLHHALKYVLVVPVVMALYLGMVWMGVTSKNYCTWSVGMWELKEFALSSIAIPIITGVSITEIQRHRNLNNQFGVYHELMYDAQKFIVSLCETMGIVLEYDICTPYLNMFYSWERFNDFQREIKEKEKNLGKEQENCGETIELSSREVPRYIGYVICFDQFLNVLHSLREILMTYTFVGPIDDALRLIDCACSRTQKEKTIIEYYKIDYSDKEMVKFIDDIASDLMNIIIDIRHPWRWDVELNNRIKDLIWTNGLEERYYL